MPGLAVTQLAPNTQNQRFSESDISFFGLQFFGREAQSGFLEGSRTRRTSRATPFGAGSEVDRCSCWLEDASSVTWLVDDIARDAIGFLREHIPRKNSQGRILYSIHTEDVAKAVSNLTRQRDAILELHVADLEDATTLLFDADIDMTDVTSSASVKRLVGIVGRLPLAIVQAAAFMKQSKQSIVQPLQIYKNSELKTQVFLTFPPRYNSLSSNVGDSDLHLSESISVSQLSEVAFILDPESIPVNQVLVEGAKKMLEKSPQSMSYDSVQEVESAIAELKRY
ncbi:hypothetical protein SERLADRAFT_439452 [Serpula lacrymans var. lacrymans S7.9]|uniref:Uncharacterized protein n=1 Tax=Serpula lacrymans var. lacrymans (strain S7.9) TaxID=578457 RepID=F8P0D5_SERL9|nr:uncharacterized protein SERLADRAFT_439452 [Serpula lacrymans var. lacrymans S7.9]EGO24148.1 hypothetical protein SERLADRAFT_439452 [Serpula lacrymans var. lacrymans S7.9]